MAFGPENLGIEPAEIRRRVDAALKAVNMYEYRDHAPHKLSGGQKQRVAIAGVIAMETMCIVLDEPTAMLDPRGRQEVMDTIRYLNREKGITVILITHKLYEVMAISDRVGVMYLGNMVELAEADEIFHHPIHPYTEALLNAIPTTDTVGAKELSILEGDIPSPVNPPKGCKFHTRCKYCTEICTQVVPAWEEVRPNHFVACHHKLEVKE